MTAPAPRPPVTFRSVMRDPLMALWAGYIFLFPIYIIPSGLPQPADVLIIALTPIVLAGWDGRLSIPAKRAVFALLLFVIYIVIENVFWTFWSGAVSFNLRIGFLMSPLFYIYNGLVFLLALVTYKRRGDLFIEVAVRAVVITAVVNVPLTIILGRSTSLRSSGLFNGSNQLGYYAVLSASILLLGQRRARISTTMVVIGMLACTYLALVSASKAALVSTALIIIFSTVSRLRTVIVTAAVATLLIVTVDPLTDAVDRTIERVTAHGTSNLMEDRGYDRIVNNPEYWFLGAGEGGYTRFEDSTLIKSHELHSSAGTVFFCYGIAGSLLFLWFLFRIVRVAGMRQILIMIPVAAYGLSHQGLRVTELWLFLAMLVVIGQGRLLVKPAAARPRSALPAPVA